MELEIYKELSLVYNGFAQLQFLASFFFQIISQKEEKEKDCDCDYAPPLIKTSGKILGYKSIQLFIPWGKE